MTQPRVRLAASRLNAQHLGDPAQGWVSKWSVLPVGMGVSRYLCLWLSQESKKLLAAEDGGRENNERAGELGKAQNGKSWDGKKKKIYFFGPENDDFGAPKRVFHALGALLGLNIGVFLGPASA